jgi:Ran GTPase-activating protein (RanGAP) involved in mRNA processing and transport
MKTYSFDTILDLVEEMSDSDQVTLIDLIGNRLKEKRRDEILGNIIRSNQEYELGQVFRGSVDDVMAELSR